jgi:molybdopterin/thiamine biosynthesis adenylyltransferase
MYQCYSHGTNIIVEYYIVISCNDNYSPRFDLESNDVHSRDDVEIDCIAIMLSPTTSYNKICLANQWIKMHLPKCSSQLP